MNIRPLSYNLAKVSFVIQSSTVIWIRFAALSKPDRDYIFFTNPMDPDLSLIVILFKSRIRINELVFFLHKVYTRFFT